MRYMNMEDPLKIIGVDHAVLLRNPRALTGATVACAGWRVEVVALACPGRLQVLPCGGPLPALGGEGSIGPRRGEHRRHHLMSLPPGSHLHQLHRYNPGAEGRHPFHSQHAHARTDRHSPPACCNTCPCAHPHLHARAYRGRQIAHRVHQITCTAASYTFVAVGFRLFHSGYRA